MNELTCKQSHQVSGGCITLEYSNSYPKIVTITIDNKHDILHMGNFTFTRDNCYYNDSPIDSSEYNILMTKYDRPSSWAHSYTTIQYIPTGNYI